MCGEEDERNYIYLISLILTLIAEIHVILNNHRSEIAIANGDSVRLSMIYIRYQKYNNLFQKRDMIVSNSKVMSANPTRNHDFLLRRQKL